MTVLRTLTALVVLLFATGILAAGEHKDKDDEHGPNGGQLVDSGSMHLELAVKGQELMLWVYDRANKKISSQGANATATIVGQKSKINLAPAGDNLLKGSGQFEAKPQGKVLVSLTLPGQRAQQARFTPWHKDDHGEHAGHKEGDAHPEKK